MRGTTAVMEGNAAQPCIPQEIVKPVLHLPAAALIRQLATLY